jgi:pyrroline-5-carboxylate reductase
VVASGSRSSLEACTKALPGIGIAETNAALAGACRLIFICVRPLDVKGVLEEIVPVMDGDEHIVSLAAGVGIGYLEAVFPGSVTRAMPTVTLEMGLGTTLISHGRQIGLHDADRLEHSSAASAASRSSARRTWHR